MYWRRTGYIYGLFQIILIQTNLCISNQVKILLHNSTLNSLYLLQDWIRERNINKIFFYPFLMSHRMAIKGLTLSISSKKNEIVFLWGWLVRWLGREIDYFCFKWSLWQKYLWEVTLFLYPVILKLNVWMSYLLAGCTSSRFATQSNLFSLQPKYWT